MTVQDVPQGSVFAGPHDAKSPRLGVLLPNELSADQTEVYSAIAGGSRANGPRLFPLTDAQGGLTGPFNAMLTNPSIGHSLQAMGAALRFSGTLSNQAREAVILVVANHEQSEFEWEAHLRIARNCGLVESTIRAIELRSPVYFSSGSTSGDVNVDGNGNGNGDSEPCGEKEARPGHELHSKDHSESSVPIDDPSVFAAIAIAQTVVRTGDLNDRQFGEMSSVFDSGMIFEVLALVGYYQLLALMMRVFRVDQRIPV
jgi:4-carboxymuconolactone decarboxylase